MLFGEFCSACFVSFRVVSPGYLGILPPSFFDIFCYLCILSFYFFGPCIHHFLVLPPLLPYLRPPSYRGLIGPARQFGTGSIYHPHLYAIAIGAVLPIPFWLWQRRYPGSWIRYMSTPVILNGVSAIPPATGKLFDPNYHDSSPLTNSYSLVLLIE